MINPTKNNFKSIKYPGCYMNKFGVCFLPVESRQVDLSIGPFAFCSPDTIFCTTAQTEAIQAEARQLGWTSVWKSNTREFVWMNPKDSAIIKQGREALETDDGIKLSEWPKRLLPYITGRFAA